jgi:hypothetical protein
MSWIEIVPGLWRTDYKTSTHLKSNSVLVSLGDGKLAVVSPPQGADEAFFKETDTLGTVVALVAPNTGPDLGQAAWQARYADATVHAPDISAKAIAKAKPNLKPFATMKALTDRAPANVRFVDLPGTSSGSLAVSVESGGKRALVVDDCISNDPTLIGPAPVRFIFWVTGSGPGLARNKLWWWVFCKDKSAYVKALGDEWDRIKTDVVFPLHGQEIQGEDVAKARGFLAEVIA